jgi:hypothetical protein
MSHQWQARGIEGYSFNSSKLNFIFTLLVADSIAQVLPIPTGQDDTLLPQ